MGCLACEILQATRFGSPRCPDCSTRLLSKNIKKKFGGA